MKEESNNAWLKYDRKTLAAVMDFAEEYRKFISDCKTERECVDAVIAKAKSLGYKDIASVKKAKAGDILAVFSTGAYNYSMASNYNRNPRAEIVMVKDGEARTVVRRERYEDLVRNDI